MKSCHRVQLLCKVGKRNSDPTGERPGDVRSNYNNEPLVRGPIVPVTMLIELLIPGMEKKVVLKALPGLGCTRCLITLVGKLEIRLRRLKELISFCQRDGSIAGGIPATLAITPIRLTMGSHSKSLTFTVAPGMEWPLILGLAWLKKWNPWVDWRTGHLRLPRIQSTVPHSHFSPRKEPNHEAAEAISEGEL